MNPARAICFLFSAMCLSGCASPTAVSGPEEAIRLAAAHTDGAYVQLVMTVQSVGSGEGSEAGFVFLNSEPDYRNPKSLNVALSPEIVNQLVTNRKTDPSVVYLHHVIRVSGLAKRVEIGFENDATKFYYQTHLEIHSADDIQVIDEKALSAKPN